MDCVIEKYKYSSDVTMIEDNGLIAEMIVQVDLGNESVPKNIEHETDTSKKSLDNILEYNFSNSDVINPDILNKFTKSDSAENTQVEKSYCAVHQEVEDLDMNVTEEIDDYDQTNEDIEFVGEVISNVCNRNSLYFNYTEKDMATVLKTSVEKNVVNKCDSSAMDKFINFVSKTGIHRKLGNFPHICNALAIAEFSVSVYIYNLLFMNSFKKTSLTEDILNFSGFSFDRNSQDYFKRFSYLKRMQIPSLREIYTTLIYNSEIISKSEMIAEIFNFLFSLSEATTSSDFVLNQLEQNALFVESNAEVIKKDPEIYFMKNNEVNFTEIMNNEKTEVLDLRVKDGISFKSRMQAKPINDKVKHLQQQHKFSSLCASHEPMHMQYKSMQTSNTFQYPVQVPVKKSYVHSDIKNNSKKPEKDFVVENPDANFDKLTSNYCVEKKCVKPPLKKMKLSEPLAEIYSEQSSCKVSSDDLIRHHFISAIPKKQMPSQEKNLQNRLRMNIRKAMRIDSDDDCDEPLSALVGHPSDKILRQQICEIVEKCDLKEITINCVIQKIFSLYPQFNLSYRKEFIKSSVRSLLYGLGENSSLMLQHQPS